MRWALLVATLLSACDASRVAAGESEGPTYRATVDVSTSARHDVLRTLTLGAVAEADQSVRMNPMQPGRVSVIDVALGQAVKKGQLLARMDDTIQRLQLEQASQGVALALLQLEDATRELERGKALAASDALTGQALDRMDGAAKMARAQLAQGRASVALLQEQLDEGALRAPFDGVVIGIGGRPGEHYAPGASLAGPTSLVAVASLDPIRMDLFVPERDLPKVRLGMTAVVTSDIYPGQTFAGHVTAVNAAAEPGSRTFRVRVLVDNPDERLKPGLFLRAGLVLEELKDTVALPSDAILLDGDEARVVAVSDDKARHQPVEVLLRGDAFWAVQGVDEGTTVAVKGHRSLPDGAPVVAVPQ
jgi:membrane fusion protein (multidrug efflux system)